MEISEYKNIYHNEATHFFYVNTHETVLKFIKKYLYLNKKLKILDAGCGTGLLLKKMSKFGQIYGIDTHAEAIRLSKKRGLKNILKSSVLALPFKESSFDLITCIDVLYHQGVKDDKKALKEFFRVLKPGGILILKNPAYDWLKGNHDKIVHTLHRYTKKEIGNKLLKTGFKIKKVTYAYCFIFPIILIKRILEKFSNDPSSDVEEIPKFFNILLLQVQRIETWVILNFSLPFGLTVYAICQKPEKFK